MAKKSPKEAIPTNRGRKETDKGKEKQEKKKKKDENHSPLRRGDEKGGGPKKRKPMRRTTQKKGDLIPERKSPQVPQFIKWPK